MNIAGMNADGCMDGGVFGQLEIGFNVLKARTEGDHTAYTVIHGALDDLLSFALSEAVRGKVAVGVG